MSQFKQQVLHIIHQIPRGQVMSYGQVAAYAGSPRAARQVGWILNKSEDQNLPWWRVLNNSGRITIKGSTFSAHTQAQLLSEEGIQFTNLQLDIAKYRYQPTPDQLKSWQLPESYLQQIKHLAYCTFC